MICYNNTNMVIQGILNNFGSSFETKKHTSETQHRTTSQEIHGNIFSHFFTRHPQFCPHIPNSFGEIGRIALFFVFIANL